MEEERGEGEGKQLLPIVNFQFIPDSASSAHTHTHTGILVVEHINRTTKGRTVGGGGFTAARTGSATSKLNSVFSISAGDESISQSGGNRH